MIVEEAYYRSEHPQVLAFWAEFAASRREFLAGCAALAAEFPGYEAVCTLPPFPRQVVGLGGKWAVKADALPPPGPPGAWRLDDDFNFFVPDPDTPAGEAWAERLSSIQEKSPALPGMPLFVRVQSWAGAGVEVPTYQQSGATVWAQWRDVPAARVEEHSDFDAALWTRATAEEYQAARGGAEEGL